MRLLTQVIGLLSDDNACICALDSDQPKSLRDPELFAIHLYALHTRRLNQANKCAAKQIVEL